MSSYTFDPSVPPNTESPRNGATRIRNIAAAILAMLNLPTGSGAQTVGGPFISSFDAGGNPTFPNLSQVAADPTTALGLVPKQYADAKVAFVVATGGDAYAGTFPDIPTLNAGQEVTVKFPVANTGTSPSFNLNSLGAVPIAVVNGASPAIGAIKAGGIYQLIFDIATATWVMVGVSNPQSAFPLTADVSAGGFLIQMLGNAAATGDAVNLGQFPGVNNALGSFSLPSLSAGAEKTFIVNWGTQAVGSIAGAGRSTTAISFATPYVTNCFTVIAGLIAQNDISGRTCLASVVASTVTITGFTFQLGNNDSGAHNIGGYWIAIGV